MMPFVDFQPKWKGWEVVGLSPRLIGQESTVREEFVKRFINSVITAVSASTLAVISGRWRPTDCRGSVTGSASCGTRISRSSSSAS